ncbi:hypothetical protein RB213_014996 [Colletotrichum asianum]
MCYRRSTQFEILATTVYSSQICRIIYVRMTVGTGVEFEKEKCREAVAAFAITRIRITSRLAKEHASHRIASHPERPFPSLLKFCPVPPPSSIGSSSGPRERSG